MNLFLFSLLIGISWVEMQVGRAVAYHCLSSWTFNSNPSLRPSLRSLFRASTWWPLSLSFRRGYFDPQGSCEPRLQNTFSVVRIHQFRSTRLSRASTKRNGGAVWRWWFRSTRLSRASTAGDNPDTGDVPIFRSTRLSRASSIHHPCGRNRSPISIHEALASLDQATIWTLWPFSNFDPRGSREPRQHIW